MHKNIQNKIIPRNKVYFILIVTRFDFLKFSLNFKLISMHAKVQ